MDASALDCSLQTWALAEVRFDSLCQGLRLIVDCSKSHTAFRLAAGNVDGEGKNKSTPSTVSPGSRHLLADDQRISHGVSEMP